jgi:hypothetical protein
MNPPKVSHFFRPGAVLTAASLLLCAGALAQAPQPRTALSFRGVTTTIGSSVNVPPGHYTGENGMINVDGGKERRCVLDLSGCVIDDVKIQVREGSELSMRGALLRRCQIYVEPKCSVVIDGCGFEQCEFNGFSDLRRGFPTLRITNSVIANSAALKAINWLGLDMQDCLILNQPSPQQGFMATEVMGTTFADMARAPKIRYTAFTNSELHPFLFFAASHCTFTSCRILGAAAPLPGQAAVAPNPQDISLPVRWISGTPAVIPPPGRGVSLQVVNDPFPGGCRLVHEWNGSRLTIANVNITEQPKPLAPALPAGSAAVASSGGGSSFRSSSLGPASGSAKVVLQQTSVNALLVRTLPSGAFAGQVSKLTLTALPGNSFLRFSNSMEWTMETSLREVEKLIRLRHKSFPQGFDMEINWQEKYTPKGGPSAAVACALLAESCLTGQTWDPNFAVTGDINADGSIQAIGGVAAKIRGATNGSCKIIGIPSMNEPAASDVLVREGPAPLFNIIVFGLANFDEAMALAAVERSGPLKEAVNEMDLICSVLKRDPRSAPAILRSPQAIARLQGVLQKAPHCLSAKYLLAYGQNRLPTKLSLAGSLEAANVDGDRLQMAAVMDFSTASNTFGRDEMGSNITRLRNLRPVLDPRIWPYVDSLVSLGEAWRNYLDVRTRAPSRVNDMVNEVVGATNRAQAAKTKLLDDPLLREELGE